MASIYFDQVIDQFPESKWANSSLIKKIETYVIYADNSIKDKQIERYSLAIDSYEKLIQLFPQSPKRGDAEKLYSYASKKIKDLEKSTLGDTVTNN